MDRSRLDLESPAPGRLELEQLLEQLIHRAHEVLKTQERLRGLLRATREVASGVDIEQVLRHIVGAARQLVDARYAALGVVQDGRLIRFIHEGMDPETVARIGELPEGRGVLGRLVDHPRPLLLPELAAHPASVGFPEHHPPMSSFLGVPIRVQDRVFGNLYLTEKRTDGGFTGDDQELTLALASAAGIAIANASLFDDGRRRQAWQAASTRLTTDLLGGDEPAEVLSRIVSTALRLSGSDGAALFLPAAEPGSLDVAVAEGALLADAEGSSVPVTGSVAGLAVSSGHSVAVADVHTDPRTSESELAAVGAGPAIAAPFTTADGRTAALVICRRRYGAPLGDSDEEMMAAFAGHAGVAIRLAVSRLDAEVTRLAADRERIAQRLNADVMGELLAIGTAITGVAGRLDDQDVARTLLVQAERVDRMAREIGSSVFEAEQTGHQQDDEPGLVLEPRRVHHRAEPGDELRDGGADEHQDGEHGQGDHHPAEGPGANADDVGTPHDEHVVRHGETDGDEQEHRRGDGRDDAREEQPDDRVLGHGPPPGSGTTTFRRSGGARQGRKARSARAAGSRGRRPRAPVQGRGTPFDVLAERFARGEIDEEEYRRRTAVLRGEPVLRRDTG